MNEEQIKAALDSGKEVYWGSPTYPVVKFATGYYITCIINANSVPLSHGGQLNGCEEDFFVQEEACEVR